MDGVQAVGSAHSVVLTSGTLSPLEGFASELDMVFSQQLAGNHVVPHRQVGLAVVARQACSRAIRSL